MKYGQIAGNKKMNETIYRCFKYIHEKDAQKFVKKFGEQPGEGPQIMHTFRELILGAYLASSGFNVSYEYSVDSSTPDWCVFDSASKLSGIIELTTFHTDQNIESEIKLAIQIKNYWVGRMPPNDNRLYQSIWEKASVYKNLVERHCVPYVIAVYGDFSAIIDMDELTPCLYNRETGLFRLYPTISGVLFFEVKNGKYHFKYFPNSHAIMETQLPNGIFP
jgi:hypothetical protein